MKGKGVEVSNLTVVKRNGKKVDFDGSKIALAIKKGFDNVTVTNGDELEKVYTEKDIQTVYKEVIKEIGLSFKSVFSWSCRLLVWSENEAKEVKYEKG